MQVVYHADNTIDAYLVRNLLNSYGIDARVSGEYLQGAMGELPVNDLIRVLVNSQDIDASIDIIKKWQQQSDSQDESACQYSEFK